MSRFKFSIGYAMLVIAVIAVGLALLSRPTQLGVAITFSFAAFSFMLATVAAIFARKSSASYWLGFAIGGWAYLALPVIAIFSNLDNGSDAASYFLPSALLDAAFPYMVGQEEPVPVPTVPPPVKPTVPDPSVPLIVGAQENVSSDGDRFADRWIKVDREKVRGELLVGSRSYYCIGHSLFAILTALGVGAFARFLQTRRDRVTASPGPIQVEAKPT